MGGGDGVLRLTLTALFSRNPFRENENPKMSDQLWGQLSVPRTNGI